MALLVFGVETWHSGGDMKHPVPDGNVKMGVGGCGSRAVFHLFRGVFHVSGATLSV